eukprot:4533526-Amphidinium_carterae.1
MPAKQEFGRSAVTARGVFNGSLCSLQSSQKVELHYSMENGPGPPRLGQNVAMFCFNPSHHM